MSSGADQGIDLVIFDCDGVLVDSEDITTAAWVEAMQGLGLDWQAVDVGRHFHGGKLADVIAAAEADLGGPVPEGFVAQFRARLYERLGREVRPVAGIVEALEAFVWPACVASNGPRAKMEATLGSTGLLARFEGRIFSAYDLGTFKPEPGLFLHAAGACGAEPERCVVVEDSDSGVRAAVAAGMRVICYDGHGAAVKAAGAVRLGDMAGLPAALAALAG